MKELKKEEAITKLENHTRKNGDARPGYGDETNIHDSILNSVENSRNPSDCAVSSLVSARTGI